VLQGSANRGGQLDGPQCAGWLTRFEQPSTWIP
jgi:hypothetical protein